MSVKSFETEPTRYTVPAVAGVPASGSWRPNPSAQTMSEPSTRAMETAGSPLSSISWRMRRRSSPATGA
jgi:hypothetical protein